VDFGLCFRPQFAFHRFIVSLSLSRLPALLLVRACRVARKFRLGRSSPLTRSRRLMLLPRPMVLFALAFPPLPAEVGFPATSAHLLHGLLDTSLESPPNPHTLDCSVWATTLLDHFPSTSSPPPSRVSSSTASASTLPSPPPAAACSMMSSMTVPLLPRANASPPFLSPPAASPSTHPQMALCHRPMFLYLPPGAPTGRYNQHERRRC
jgi:hypothetical protein